jgi:lysine 2,3-aminomutase
MFSRKSASLHDLCSPCDAEPPLTQPSPRTRGEDTLRTPRALAEAGLIAAGHAQALQAVAARYAVAVTPAMAELVDPADPADPIARQFVPDPRELEVTPEERADPIGDHAHSPVAGIVHRYPDRVLLKPTHTCAVYCRFCFRREMVGPEGEGTLSPAELDAACAYIAGRPEVWEVILTGGDPLVLSPRRLRDLMARLAAIEHVKIVRFHTRVPAVDPAAVTPELVEALTSRSQTVYVALHADHPRELTPAARAACTRIVDAGLPMLGQTVLLKGINDDAQTLAALFRAMVETRIKPYYLHHPDLAPGTGHLRVSLEEGQAIMRALRGRVSGLCQPTYVLDVPGGYGKVPVGPQYASGEGTVQDPQGGLHVYPAREPD